MRIYPSIWLIERLEIDIYETPVNLVLKNLTVNS